MLRANLEHVTFNKNTKDEIVLESCSVEKVAFTDMPTDNVKLDRTDEAGIIIRQTAETKGAPHGPLHHRKRL
jgi:hypothetical protein